MATVLNMDIAGLVRRLRRFKYEIQKSQSANVSMFRPADAERFESYLAGMTAYLDWMQQQPLLDLVESAPRPIDLGEPEQLSKVDNEAVADILEHFRILEIELINSQSARNGNRLISHDERRVRALIERLRLFATDYIQQVQPVDLPESSPLTAHTGSGRGGINLG